MYLCFFGTNKNFQYSSPEPRAARQHSAAPGGGECVMVHLGCWSLDVWVCKSSIHCSSTRCNLHFQWALGLLMQSFWTPRDLCRRHPMQLITCEGSGKVNRTVYPFSFCSIFYFFLPFLFFPSHSAYGGRKKKREHNRFPCNIGLNVLENRNRESSVLN